MKKYISLLLAAALCLGLLGCRSQTAGPGGSAPGKTESSSSGAGSRGEESSAGVSGDSESGWKRPENLTSDKLVLYTWEGMFPAAVLAEFTQETGVEITYANFDYDETMLAKLETAQGGEYDLVIADDYIIETVIRQGLAQKLNPQWITNLDNVDPIFRGQFFDPNDEYTVPYGAGVQTIVYNPAAVEKEITGYKDLWDPALQGNLGVVANYRVINGMALKVLGKSYNEEDPAVISQAGEKLLELAPNIRLINDMNLQDDLLTGEVSAAVMYTSQVTMAKLADPSLQVVFPQEGVGFGIMGMFVPSQAPHPDAAHAFIEYLLRPEVAARCFEYLGYYCTNREAKALISEEYRDFLTLPGDLAREDMEMIENISAEALDAHDQAWTAFKAACQ